MKLRRINNEINKSKAVGIDDRPNRKYLMCLFHYSVSVTASVAASVSVSEVLAARSMALKWNCKGIHKGSCFLLTCTSGSRFQWLTLEVPVDKTY